MTAAISADELIPTIPESQPAFGPVQARLRRRTLLIYSIVAITGALPTLLSATGIHAFSPAWQAFGLGLWFPGAGFIAAGGWFILLAPLAYLLFWVMRVMWSFTGMMALPIAAWLGAAAIAATMTEGTISSWALPVVALCAAAIGAWGLRSEHRFHARRRQRAQARRQYLDAAVFTLDTVSRPEPDPAARELSAEDLAAARYLFDRALQPVGKFEGFSRYDNFQLCALRYQLNYISYGLGLMQCHYTPNFHGYLNAAQRYAIESLALPEVCGYWKWESWFGAFSPSANPVGKDNVMLTGWSLIGISTYGANTGDLRYQQPGVLPFRPFRHFDRVYPHDAGTFVESLATNWEAAPYALYPCEPYWSFPICNALGMCGVIPYDRSNGTAHMERHRATLLQQFESEFLLEDGDVAVVRSDLTGLDFVVRAMPSSAGFLNQLSMAAYFNAIHPGHARRAYALARHESIRLENGELSLKLPWKAFLDVGNYSRSPGLALATLALAAREQGDDAVAEAALRRVDELVGREPGESISYRKASCAANVMLATARWARRNDWKRMIVDGPAQAALRGPLLAGCRYPDVLVARAISDGEVLDLVLYNGAASGKHLLNVERLKPMGEYIVLPTGERLQSDAQGCAAFSVFLDGRTPIRLVPAA